MPRFCGARTFLQRIRNLMSICQFPPPDRFWIFLTDLHEPEENSLRLIVAEAVTVERKEIILAPASSLAPIMITSDSRRFELVWKDYVAYSVRNESFARQPSFVGAFGERKSSAYLRFLEETTFATSVVQRPMRHWEVNCLNHCIDVVSFDEPAIRELENSVEDGISAKSN